MKIIEAINKIDEQKRNTYTQDEKLAWLNRLEWMIKLDIVDTHEGGESVTFTGYNSDTPVTTELIASAPHDEVYLRWLEAQIDYTNGEMGKYDNSYAMFNTAYTAFSSYYNRTHMPKSTSLKFF